jgi:hypothetical protein
MIFLAIKSLKIKVMNDGYIKLHRTILDSNIFASAYGLKIWIWCLLKATYKTKHIPVKIGKGETIVTIQPGQFIFGRFTAEESLCIDGSTIYKWINKFKDEDMIKLDSNSHYTIITICKWDEYQQINDDEVTAIQQPFNSHSTAIQQPRNTNKNIKESKEYKEEEYIPVFDFKKELLNLGINKQVVSDWLDVRKAKKARNTETAFKGLLKQIELSGLTANECITIAVEKSWQGFDAKWLQNIELKNKENAGVYKVTQSR